MWQKLLDAFFPRQSLSGTSGSWLTEAERCELRPLPIIFEGQTLKAQQCLFLDRIVAANSYDASPFLRTAIHRFKYSHVPAYGEILGQMLADTISIVGTYHHDDILCPVPLHWMRTFQRGFNQSDILAQTIARFHGLAVLPLLKRIRPTGHQAHRSGLERRKAMRHSFQCIETMLPPTVILIDDVSTTGSTLDACAQALKEAGVERVEGLVVAMG